jgi:hypothetical protein
VNRNPVHLLFGFLIFIIFFLTPSIAKAVSVTFLSFPSIITTEPFSLSVYISGPHDGTNYLRIDLFKSGTGTYFGETFNGSIWYGEDEGNNYFPITIVNSTASAVIRGRLNNPLPVGYSGPGIYKMRIRRYITSSGYVDDQTPIDVDIQIPLPTPTPSLTPTTTPSSTPSPTSSPTSSPTATPIKTPTPTPKKTSSPEPVIEGQVEGTSSAIDLFGLRNQLNTPTPTPEGEETTKSKTPILAFIFIGLGITLFGFSGFTLYKGGKGIYNSTSGTGNEKIL